MAGTNGGRPKGVANRNKRGLLARLQQEFGKDYNPVLSMAKIAHEVDDNGDYVADSHTRFGYHERIANFTVPRLKQVEHINDDGPLVVQLLKYADDSDSE